MSTRSIPIPRELKHAADFEKRMIAFRKAVAANPPPTPVPVQPEVATFKGLQFTMEM